MSFETSLVTALTGHAGLAALISGRCEPGTLPPGTPLPAIVYLIVSDPPEQDGSGVIIGERYHVQVSCFAETVDAAGGYADVIALAAQVRLALVAFAGSSYKLTGISHRDADTPNPETGIYHRAVDAIFDSIPPVTLIIYQTSMPENEVIIYDPREDAPRTTRALESAFDSMGALVAYEGADGMEIVTLRGRLLSLTPAHLIAAWADAGELLSYTNRVGTTTTGWRIQPNAPPLIRHAPTGTDWTLDMRLWRIP